MSMPRSRTETSGETTYRPGDIKTTLAGFERPAWLDEKLYPFRSCFISIDGSRVHYIDEGSGPALLFLHAAPAWSFIYRNFVKGLRDSFRCIAFDYPGFGLSTAPRDYQFTLPALSHTVERLILDLGLSDLTMFVHDSGGPVGLGAAGRMPERIRALVITDAFGWPLTNYPQVARMLRFVSGKAFGFFHQRFNILPRLVAGVAPQRRKLSKAERAAYREAFPTRESRRRILAVFRELAENKDYLHMVERGLRERLYDKPTLLIYGEKDPVRKVGFLSRFEEIFLHHRTVIIKGEGHFPHEGAPEDMVAAIRDWWPSVV